MRKSYGKYRPKSEVLSLLKNCSRKALDFAIENKMTQGKHWVWRKKGKREVQMLTGAGVSWCISVFGLKEVDVSGVTVTKEDLREAAEREIQIAEDQARIVYAAILEGLKVSEGSPRTVRKDLPVGEVEEEDGDNDNEAESDEEDTNETSQNPGNPDELVSTGDKSDNVAEDPDVILARVVKLPPNPRLVILQTQQGVPGRAVVPNRNGMFYRQPGKWLKVKQVEEGLFVIQEAR